MSSALERLQRLEQGRAQRGGPPTPDGGSGRKKGVIAGALGAVTLVLLKGKGLALLALTKLKLVLVLAGKFFTTGWSMVLMGWTYSWFYGWPFAAGLVGLILVHELGHGAAAKLVGLRVGAPVFIPFMGAYIAVKDKLRSRQVEFIVAAGGPLIGGLASLVCLAVSLLVGGLPLLRAVGYFGLVMNLFNLTPFWTLDGARMMRSVRPTAGLVGVGLTVVVLLVTARAADHLDVFAVIAVAVAAFRIGDAAWRTRRAPRTLLEQVEANQLAAVTPDDDMAPGVRLRATAVYFAMLAGYTAAVQLLFPLLPRVG